MTTKERQDFQLYLRQCTDRQVEGVYRKEKEAARKEEAGLAYTEALRRGLYLFD